MTGSRPAGGCSAITVVTLTALRFQCHPSLPSGMPGVSVAIIVHCYPQAAGGFATPDHQKLDHRRAIAVRPGRHERRAPDLIRIIRVSAHIDHVELPGLGVAN